jgi:glycine cleavage system H protein
MADCRILPGRVYTAEDTWVYQTSSGRVRLGITDYAQQQLKEIVYLDLPAAGHPVAKGASVGEVESIKSVSDLYCPVGGTVSAINEAAVEDPTLLNRDPYGEGWIVELECPAFAADTADQMDSDGYRALRTEQ